jgi:CheY-specific phosphatase CheX
MAVKFFGQFLLEKGAVSQKDLLRAIALQESTNLKFGETALQMGFITEADVVRVHNAQRSEDLRFGDMAVKLGILTETQLKEVLTRQKNNHLYIGEALLRIGALDETRLAHWLGEFKTDQAPYALERIAIPSGVPQPAVWEMMADLSYKMLTRVANLTFRTAPCEVITSLPFHEVVAAMDFSGSVEGRYLLGTSASLQKALARAILMEEEVDGEPQEVLDDTVMEFANIVLGNVAAKATQLGKSIEIAPPQVFHPTGEEVAVPENHFGLLFPVHVSSGGRIDLAVFIR